MNLKRCISVLLLSCAAMNSIYSMREVHSLNGEWIFCVDSMNLGELDYKKGLNCGIFIILIRTS